MNDVDTSFQEYWDEIRPPNIRPGWTSYANPLHDYPKGPILLAEGPTEAHRHATYKAWKDGPVYLRKYWSTRGPISDFTNYCLQGAWPTLTHLITIPQLDIQEPLRTLVDQGSVLSTISRAIHEIRFSRAEGIAVPVTALSKWVSQEDCTISDHLLWATRLDALGLHSPLRTPYDRLDVLFFIATLAYQNDGPKPDILIFDNLNEFLKKDLRLRKELFDLCVAADRWSKLGSPFQFVFGYSAKGSTLTANRKLEQKLRQYASV